MNKKNVSVSIKDLSLILIMILMLGTLTAVGINIVKNHSNLTSTAISLNAVEDAERVYFDRNSSWTKEPTALSTLGSVSATTGESTSDKIVSIYYDYQRNLWLAIRNEKGNCEVREIKDPLVVDKTLNLSFEGTCTASIISALGD